MSDVATFFRDRKKDPGETYQLTLEGWRGTHRVLVYSQRPIESRALQDQSVTTQQELELALKDLRNAITSGSGGGMIVVVNDDDRSRTFNVVRVNAKPYAAAQGFVMLSPGRPATFVTIDGNSRVYKCAAGSHALVPVSEDAQQRLQDFIGYLSWLSPDIESLVLNAIRRPSLDRRLDRVETRLFSQTSTEALAGASEGILGRIRNWAARPVPAPLVRIVGALLLVLLIAMNGVALFRLFSKEDVVGIQEPSKLPKSSAAAPIADDAKALLEAVRKSNDPLLRKIDAAHFQSLQTDETAQEALSQPQALWGLVKLQMLAIQPQPPRTEFLDHADAVEPTNEAYRAIPAKAITADARRFFSAVGCRMHTKGKMPFQSLECKNVPDGAFEAGLRNLTTFVKGQP